MKRTLIALIAVLLLSLSLCAYDMFLTRRVADELDDMRVDALRKLDAGDLSGAREGISVLAQRWSGYERRLEILVPHSDLHNVTDLIIESGALLEVEDIDDLKRALALMKEALNHLYSEQRLALSNIL